MENKFKKFKNNIASIHWPTKKILLRDTTMTVIVSAILATLIFGWSTLIEFGVNWVVALF